MLQSFFSSVNYWAVLTAAAAYWILGFLWFSMLFGGIWSSELEKHGVKIKQSSKGEMMMKLIQTFVLNLVIAFGTAFFVNLIASANIVTAIKLGLLLGMCFSTATIGIAYTWESRSLKLMFVDCGYPLMGIIISSIILSLWR